MIDLLKKWLNGTARATDEKKLEAQAREDNFLADALDGYRSKPESDHSGNIARLKDQLKAKSKDRNRVIVWWRIAAAAALIGVVGTWLVINQNTNSIGIAAKDEAQEEMMEPASAREEPTAETRVAPPVAAVPEAVEEREELAADESQSGSANPPQAGTDSDRVTREQKEKVAKESSREDPASSENQKALIFENEVLADEAITLGDTAVDRLKADDQATQPAIALSQDKISLDSNSQLLEGEQEARVTIVSPKIQPQVKTEAISPAAPARALSESRNQAAKKREAPPAGKMEKDFNTLTLKGSVIESDSEEPLIGASVSIKGTGEGTITDFDGYFEISSNQALPWVLVLNYTGYESQEVRVERVEDELVIELEEGDVLLDEVVVTGYSGGPKVITVEPKPRGGWKKFERYLKENLRYPESAKDQALEGEVSLEFYINKKGIPEQIEIRNSSCVPCNEEAIRLLRDGPRWRGKERLATISIPFNL